MFTKKVVKLDPTTTDTIIGQSTVFEGRIKSEASLRVEGQIIGDIECMGDVSIGETGLAQSNISAREVVIAGRVEGNVTAKGTLNITSSGQLTGNTTSKALVISEGGVFQGTSKMDNKSDAKPDNKAEGKTDAKPDGSTESTSNSNSNKSDSPESKLPNLNDNGSKDKNMTLQPFGHS